MGQRCGNPPLPHTLQKVSREPEKNGLPHRLRYTPPCTLPDMDFRGAARKARRIIRLKSWRSPMVAIVYEVFLWNCVSANGHTSAQSNPQADYQERIFFRPPSISIYIHISLHDASSSYLL